MIDLRTHEMTLLSCLCRELEAFVFVFETANRIVVEKTKREHATYFFEIEEPLAVSCQVTISTLASYCADKQNKIVTIL